MAGRFEWDESKDADNRRKHGVGFALAREAFLDPARVVARDLAHSDLEDRYSLLRPGRWRNPDSTIHLPEWRDQDFRGRLLAPRKADL